MGRRKKELVIDEEFDLGFTEEIEAEITPVSTPKILDALVQTEKEPCVKHGVCDYYHACKTNSLACMRFVHYCSKGISLSPAEKKSYKTGKKKNENGEPTRAIFKMIFPNCDLPDELTKEEQEQVIYGMQEDDYQEESQVYTEG